MRLQTESGTKTFSTRTKTHEQPHQDDPSSHQELPAVTKIGKPESWKETSWQIRFPSMLRLEREYLQLHRDTTVQSLTTRPLLQDGVVVYQDLTLVSAVRHGRVLIIHEADKAPLEVIADPNRARVETTSNR